MSVQTPVSTKYNAYRNNTLKYNLRRKRKVNVNLLRWKLQDSWTEMERQSENKLKAF